MRQKLFVDDPNVIIRCKIKIIHRKATLIFAPSFLSYNKKFEFICIYVTIWVYMSLFLNSYFLSKYVIYLSYLFLKI